jgi:hypothetical protein
MKKLTAFACALAMAAGLTACSLAPSTSQAPSSQNETSGAPAETTTSTAPSNGGEQKEAGGSGTASVTIDVSNVDFDVAAMGDEEAFAFMDGFINRTPDQLDADEGKVMHIVGQVSRYTKKDNGEEKVSDSVGIKGEGGTLKSVCFYVEGWGADDYPPNQAKVEVTGVWGKVEGYGNAAGRTLICNATDVRVLE